MTGRRTHLELHPGSAWARARGCLCPVRDNAYGNPELAAERGGWTIVTGCPLHDPTEQENAA